MSAQTSRAASQELNFISSSELEPVFKAMLVDAVRVCKASYGALFHRDEKDGWQATAMLGAPTEFVEFWQRGARRPDQRTALSRVVETALNRAVETRQTVHIEDVTTELVYIEGESVYMPAADCGGFRTFFKVPIFEDDELISVLAIYRQEVRPFTAKQIERAQNLSVQAVIAMQEIWKAREQELISGSKKWISPEAAIETIKNYLKTTEGHARKLLLKARKRGAVDFRNEDPAAPRRSRRRYDYAYNEDDLLGWLDRKFGERKTGESEPSHHRDAGDIPRLEEGRKLRARGMSKSAAARELVKSETGGTPEEHSTLFNRLRKKL
jgi:hypothetical protein